MAQLYFKYGAMGSSKTANALMARFNYEERGQKTLLVKPRMDQRDGDHMVHSRIGLEYPCVYFDEMRALSEDALKKEFYQKASRLEGQNSFESIAQSCIMKVFLRVFERSAATKKPKYVWLTPERIAAYYAQSMCYIVMNWIQSGMTISARELAEIYDYIIKRSMEDILAEL